MTTEDRTTECNVADVELLRYCFTETGIAPVRYSVAGQTLRCAV